MNDRTKRLSSGAAIFLLSLVPFETNLSQNQNQLIKPCTAETTPKKNEDTTNAARKKGRKRQNSRDEKRTEAINNKQRTRTATDFPGKKFNALRQTATSD